MRLNWSVRNLAVFVLCLAMALLIDGLDVVTGEEYEFFIFYFLPVGLAAWTLGLAPGIIISLFSAGAWFQSDWLTYPEHSWQVESWDTAMRLLSFLALSLTLSRIRRDLNKERRLNEELNAAMKEIKQLQGILPMCSFCRKIRDHNNAWVMLEKYIADHSDAQVSHGLCPDCYKKYYGSENGT